MTIRRRFLLPSALVRLIQRERGGVRQIEGFFPEQQDRTLWVRLEESRALLLLRTVGPDGDIEEQTEIPVGHAHALLDVCAGEVDYTRTALPIRDHMALIDQVLQPGALHLVTVEFDTAEEARGFDPQPWFGLEVTADNRFNYQALALRDISEAPEIPLSNAALNSLLDTLESRFGARTRVATNHPTGKQMPQTRTQVAGLAPANESTKIDLTDIEAAMMREMERTLQENRT